MKQSSNFLIYKQRKGLLLLSLILIIVFFNNYFEISYLMKNGNIDLTVNHSPILIKALKDFVFFFLMAIAIIFSIIKNRALLINESALVIYIVLLLFLVSIFSNGVVVALSGLRWFAPVLLFFFLRSYGEVLNLSFSARLLSYFLLLNVIFQIWQLYNMPPVYGEIYPGISARVPGIFVIPNTTAFFACLCVAMSITFDPSRNKSAIVIVLGAVSCLMTQSGTGVFVILCLLAYRLYMKFGPIIIMLSLPLLLLVFLNLDFLLGRDDFLSISGGTRLDIFISVLKGSINIDEFGLYTNTGNLWLAQRNEINDGVFVVDSYYASLVGNFGLTALIVVALTVLYFLHDVGKKWRHVIPLIIVYGLFSFTTIVSEAYPMNIILPIVLSTFAFLCRNSRKSHLPVVEGNGDSHG
jgi:hypothetical protein